MKKIHISFGNEKYYKSLDLLEKTSLEIGKVDKFIRYTKEWLKTTEFWNKNLFILNNERGAGYWLWKPFIILEAFNELENGDIVMYSDAGLKVIDDVSTLFNITKNNFNKGKLLFRVPGGHILKTWTKRDCFVLMGADEEKYWNGYITNGAISLWEKSDDNVEYLKSYLRYLRDPRIITDSINMCGSPNFIEFKDHRHDQSVLSILSIKNNFELYRDPTQWGNDEKNLFTNSPYNQLFDHHRGNIK